MRMFGRVINVPRERRREIRIVAGRVGDDVVAPISKNAAVGIGEAVGGVGFKFPRARFEAVDGGVVVAHRADGGFDRAAMKNAVAQISGAAGVEAKRIRRVMRIRRIQAHEHAFQASRPCRCQNRRQTRAMFRRLHEQHTVFVKLKTGRRIQVINEMSHLVGLAGAVGVFKYQKTVADLAVGCAFGIIFPRGDPEAAFGVPRHLQIVRLASSGNCSSLAKRFTFMCE